MSEARPERFRDAIEKAVIRAVEAGATAGSIRDGVEHALESVEAPGWDEEFVTLPAQDRGRL